MYSLRPRPVVPVIIPQPLPFPPTHPALARALTERAFTDPTAVQTAILAPETVARDILVSAQTGSGKTVAFGLALAPELLGDADRLPRAGLPLALVIAPTRELALQVHRELTWLYQHAAATVVACVGGMDSRQERRALGSGCHIVVGTPGRLRDHIERRGLDVSGLKAVVLDEADEMLEMGFREDLEFILNATPKDRRTLMLSATIPRGIALLAKNYQRDAVRVDISDDARGHADIDYRVMRVAATDIEHAVVNVLRYFESPGALVFCNTRDSVRHLSAILLERGFAVVTLSGELSQGERNFALQSLRDGKARVCVATDVAARGIDLPSLGLVIHADLPHDADTLRHRSGRTGRAGRKGISVMLVAPARRKHTERLLSAARIPANWCGLPTADDIRKLDADRLLQTILQDVAAVADASDIAMAQDLMARVPAETIAAAFVRGYRARLPAAEDVSDVPGESPGPRRKSVPDDSRHRGSDQPRDSFKASFTTPEQVVWFKLNVGRRDNADPKWLIPEICKQGAIAKRHIGAIRILDGETKFEVDQKAAAGFADLVSRITKGRFRIEPSEAPAAGEQAGRKRWTARTSPAADGEHGQKREKPRWKHRPGGKPWSGTPGKAHRKDKPKPT